MSGYTVLRLGFLASLLAFVFLSLYLSRTVQRFPLDRYEKRKDLSQSYLRAGLNVDNLPVVKIDYGAYKPDERPGTDTENDEKINERRARCLTRGEYLGKKNEFVDCADYCKVSSNDVVKYAYVTTPERLIAGRKPMQRGAWCLPTRAANCNPFSSLVVYSISNWICVPRTDALVGEGGNQIAVCDGRIYDHMLGRVYKDYIPGNLVFNDFYNDRLSDGRFRFTCVPGTRDEVNNQYLESPLNRFHLLHNWCAVDIPFAGAGHAVPDLETGTCKCSDPYSLDKNTGRCNACPVGFDEDTFTFNPRVQPCFSSQDYVSFIARMRKELKDGEILRPCGIDRSDSTAQEATRPRCLRNYVAAFSPLAPSPATLRYIRKRLN